MTRQVKNEIVLREEDGNAFLFDPDTGRVSVINGTGVIIWKELTAGKSNNDIIQTLKKEFSDVDEKKLQTDCADYIKKLTELGYMQ